MEFHQSKLPCSHVQIQHHQIATTSTRNIQTSRPLISQFCTMKKITSTWSACQCQQGSKSEENKEGIPHSNAKWIDICFVIIWLVLQYLSQSCPHAVRLKLRIDWTHNHLRQIFCQRWNSILWCSTIGIFPN